MGNILAGGRATSDVAKYLAGGLLTALTKNKEGSPLDICPIVSFQNLRHPFQLGVATPAGA